MEGFKEWMRNRQEEWRARHVTTKVRGVQNRRAYYHVLPKAIWEENLWPGIRQGQPCDLRAYLGAGVQHHTGVHNLMSSWVACANLYFPFRSEDVDRELVAGFLRGAVDSRIEQVTGIELEWAGPGEWHPSRLLGEADGQRGSGQTSPDVAFEVRAKVEGRLVAGVVLVESKLTEESFYPCSARTTKDGERRPGNPDPSRCLDVARLARNPAGHCHQALWGRRYWDHLRPHFEGFAALNRCPAATGGYQLLRQQALAEGLRAKGAGFVATCVAYDERNDKLLRCLGSTGLADLRDFGGLFEDALPLALFTHQAWWAHVRKHGGRAWQPWVRWIQERYLFEGR